MTVVAAKAARPSLIQSGPKAQWQKPDDECAERGGPEHARPEPLPQADDVALEARVAGAARERRRECKRRAGAEPHDHGRHVEEEEQLVASHTQTISNRTISSQIVRRLLDFPSCAPRACRSDGSVRLRQ